MKYNPWMPIIRGEARLKANKTPMRGYGSIPKLVRMFSPAANYYYKLFDVQFHHHDEMWRKIKEGMLVIKYKRADKMWLIAMKKKALTLPANEQMLALVWAGRFYRRVRRYGWIHRLTT